MIPDDENDVKSYYASGGGKFGTDLLRVLGLEGQKVSHISIYVDASDLVYVDVTFRMSQDQADAITQSMGEMTFQERS